MSAENSAASLLLAPVDNARAVPRGINIDRGHDGGEWLRELAEGQLGASLGPFTRWLLPKRKLGSYGNTDGTSKQVHAVQTKVAAYCSCRPGDRAGCQQGSCRVQQERERNPF